MLVEDEDQVLGKVVQPAAPQAAAEVLPLTGADPSALLGLAGLLLSSGGGLMLASRKRR
ncbi:MAG: LPXTG cell wall anchor domain-containing protein [Actinomycetota bacterium]|nr:LPXTG cell wall anchor domain-containing protein [Actinomycetota bacterium]